MTQPPAYAPQPEYVEPVSRFNVPVAVLAVLAAVLGVLSITALDWYRGDYTNLGGSSGSATFGDLHDELDGVTSTGRYSFGVSPVYFGWLAYVLIALAVVGALVCAAVPARGLHIVAALIAVGGLAVTLWAVQLVHVDGSGPGYVDYLKHTSFGAWAMLLAFALCLVAALIRPRRQRSRGY